MAADNQPDAEVFLELLARGRQSRLRDVARFRRAREVLLARERNEVGQVTNQHRNRSSPRLVREYTVPRRGGARSLDALEHRRAEIDVVARLEPAGLVQPRS